MDGARLPARTVVSTKARLPVAGSIGDAPTWRRRLCRIPFQEAEQCDLFLNLRSTLGIKQAGKRGEATAMLQEHAMMTRREGYYLWLDSWVQEQKVDVWHTSK